MSKKTVFISTGIILAAVIVGIVGLIFIPKMINPQETIQTYWPTEGWRTSTPEAQGLDSTKLVKVLEVIQAEKININSLLVIRNGSVILDAYFHNPYDGAYPHDMASVTKSIMTTLIGIAVGQGKIDLDKPVLSYFPDLTIANVDERKQQLTVRDLTGMVNGFESGCLADDLGTIAAMRAGSSDWVQSALDRKMVLDPGSTFCYDSPGMHILSGILQRATGMTSLEFARQYLFTPLGIQEVTWETDLQGRSNGWGDLHMKPLDAAKIGYLFLNHGVWEGVQIVPADWVEQASQPHVQAGEDKYGYGWWINDMSFAAKGRGGQNIFIVPSLNAIVVTTGSGFEYDQIDPYMLASVIDPKNPLPANPSGVAQLQSAVASFESTPSALPSGSSTGMAQSISGKTYKLVSNPFGLEAMKFDLTNPAQAVLYLTRQGGDLVMNIGLDNQYRLSTDGSQMRGYWQDPQTFVIEKFDVGLNDIRCSFSGDGLVVDIEGQQLKGELVNE